ncbi:MAG TPA: hypothetical protein VMB27_00820 [Solirubrobacteraceae bacterium]|nr:hypothetical protein [Solirubrobacteraceae bacterium]
MTVIKSHVLPNGNLEAASCGAGTSKLVCVHASPTFITEWLE